MSAAALRCAALATALALAGCQSAPPAARPGTVTSGATTVTTGGMVRIDAGYVGG